MEEPWTESNSGATSPSKERFSSVSIKSVQVHQAPVPRTAYRTQPQNPSSFHEIHSTYSSTSLDNSHELLPLQDPFTPQRAAITSSYEDTEQGSDFSFLDQESPGDPSDSFGFQPPQYPCVQQASLQSYSPSHSATASTGSSQYPINHQYSNSNTAVDLSDTPPADGHDHISVLPAPSRHIMSPQGAMYTSQETVNTDENAAAEQRKAEEEFSMNRSKGPYTPPFQEQFPPEKSGSKPSLWKRRRVLCIFLIILGIIIIAAAVAIPVAITQTNKHSNGGSSSSSSGSSGSSPSSTGSSGSGSSGSGSSGSGKIPSSVNGTILDISTWLDKTDFNTTYTNATVGGLSIMGLNSTWDDTTQANKVVPPLDQNFTYGQLPIRGVNLGGWLIAEPFITPSLFDYDEDLGVVDEWTLVDYLNSTKGMDGVKNVLESHYSSFVTESTFQEIQQAGLDHVRIPYGYWAVKTFDGDHFLPQISWRYLLRGIEWARKYGLRVNVDLHSVPGGQNGWNHSGRQGIALWLNGTQGEYYGNLTLELHDQLAEFFAQDRYRNLVTIYGLVNEPRMEALNVTEVLNWTSNAYDLVRSHGYNNTIVFGDGFRGADLWKGVYPPDRYPNFALDLHQYTIFNVDQLALTHNGKLNFVCAQWAGIMKGSSDLATGHGPTFVGEWSQADNDCALYLNNVNVGSRWEGDFNPGYGAAPVLSPLCATPSNCSCDVSNGDPVNYPEAYKTFLLQFAEAQMEVFESGGGWGSMYWTWDTETINATQWSYKKARDAGIMPEIAYQRSFNCSMTIPDYVALGLPETF